MSPETLKAKAREICYALVRVSFYIKRGELRQRLEGLAFQLLENTAFATVEANDKPAINQVMKNIAALDTLVRMGHSIYEIEPVNATILVRELDSFNSAIRQFGNLEQALPNLETFFATSLSTIPDKSPVEIVKVSEQSLVAASQTQSESNSSLIGSAIISSVGNENDAGNGMKNMAIRQTAIVEKIKSCPPAGGCRLKDLTTEFPQVSERTLRYDLQRLAEQGIVQRIGNGGPASYYRMKLESNS